jgi:hypothetical protein
LNYAGLGAPNCDNNIETVFSLPDGVTVIEDGKLILNLMDPELNN